MQVQNRVGDPYRQYRDNQILMSGPAELLLMLFDGALRFTRRAREALERREYDEAHHCVDRAQQIITELSASLDFNRGELPRNLFSLYEYINYLLLTADIGRNDEPLAEAETMLLSLRESWAEAGRLAGAAGRAENRGEG